MKKFMYIYIYIYINIYIYMCIIKLCKVLLCEIFWSECASLQRMKGNDDCIHYPQNKFENIGLLTFKYFMLCMNDLFNEPGVTWFFTPSQPGQLYQGEMNPKDWTYMSGPWTWKRTDVRLTQWDFGKECSCLVTKHFTTKQQAKVTYFHWNKNCLPGETLMWPLSNDYSICAMTCTSPCS